ncbi:unnamed protein product [Nippostrongylus brasiliensis]|uniref:Neuropeptide-Like Protein n=1 Tax=Nippostrongylus brasiliensis TaxID=27835 RepID=A0A0N4YQ91_NIPBR|nr:hypothetical protein Q1695_014007 [Nippostrongylus brasiliensis]VDL83148.1 unnamed protein product [Nippostrongylus brasiliensis]
MLVPSLIFLIAVAYANEDEDSATSGEMILMEVPDYATEYLGRVINNGAKRAAMPFSGGMYGKRASLQYPDIKRAQHMPFSGGMYGKRSEGVVDDVNAVRQGWSGKRAAMPFSGGLYGKRAAAMPFSGGLYGKRAAMPFSGGLSGKRSARYIRSPMPISGGFFG